MRTNDVPAGTTAAPRTAPAAAPADPAAPAPAMTHRQVLEALSGLLLALFVAMLSSTVVSNALPVIVADLGGSESGYTWVVVATLLAMTATTPLWGKLADLFDKKLLVQSALGIFAVGSVVAALAPSMGVLIGGRAVQGLGVGGLTALVQVVIASMVSPRERGRYSGYIGAVFALATVSGPLLGGLIVDTPFLGWRWCFAVGIPVAALALVVLQRTLHLPVVTREVHIDWAGAALIAGGVSALLTWVSLAGHEFAWLSTPTFVVVPVGVLLLATAVVVELRVSEPIIPLRLFRERTIALATGASVAVGVAMFGATIYLSQYFQLARGMSPTQAGLMQVAMVGGLLVSSIGTGRLIAATGSWKRYLVGGMSLVVTGLVLLSTIDESTPLVLMGFFMAVLGIGVGATMQNLVLAVQNATAQRDMGAVSSVVAFFRSLGGTVGVAVLGAVLGHRVATEVTAGLQRLGVTPSGDGRSIPDLSSLPGPVREVVTSAYAEGTATLFLVAVPFAVVALVLVSLIREVPLRTTVEREDELAGVAASVAPTDPGAGPDALPDADADALPDAAADALPDGTRADAPAHPPVDPARARATTTPGPVR